MKSAIFLESSTGIGSKEVLGLEGREDLLELMNRARIDDVNSKYCKKTVSLVSRFRNGSFIASLQATTSKAVNE